MGTSVAEGSSTSTGGGGGTTTGGSGISSTSKGEKQTTPPQHLTPGSKKTREMFKEAVSSQRSGDTGKALKLVDLLTRKCPEHAKGWALKSMLSENARSAVKAAEKAYSLRPDLLASKRALAAALTRLDFEEEGGPTRKRTGCGLLKRAADLCPEDARAQFRLGRAARQLKQPEEAANAFRKAVRADPAHERAAFWLAAIAGEGLATRAPEDHVRALYDDYAARYDHHLEKTLQSRAPELVAKVLARVVRQADAEVIRKGDKDEDGPTPQNRIGCDLGCGTGLSGAALKQVDADLNCVWRGVDLSPKMCAKARDRGVYADVRAGDLLDALERDPSYDIVVSCDVLVYFGDLDPFFAAAAANARKGVGAASRARTSPPPDMALTAADAKRAADFALRRSRPAVLALSLEDCGDAPDFQANAWDLAPTGRFRHSPAYVLNAAKAHGWHLEADEAVQLRRQAGEPVKGRVYVLSHSGAKSWAAGWAPFARPPLPPPPLHPMLGARVHSASSLDERSASASYSGADADDDDDDACDKDTGGSPVYIPRGGGEGATSP